VRAGGAVDAPAPGQSLDEVESEAAAALQIGGSSRDRSAAAAIPDVEAQDVGADMGADVYDGIGGRVGVPDTVGDELADQQPVRR